MDARNDGVSLTKAHPTAHYVHPAHVYSAAPAQLDRHAMLRPPKLGHHLKYDAHVLANYGIAMRGQRFDSMLESYVLNSVATNHNMDSAAQRYLGVKTIQYEEVAGKGAKKITFNQ